MILVRNHSVDKQHSRKLKAKWLKFRILIKYTKQERSVWVKEFYGSSKAKRYHIDDLILYHEREATFVGNIIIITSTRQSSFRITIQSNQRTLRLQNYWMNIISNSKLTNILRKFIFFLAEFTCNYSSACQLLQSIIRLNLIFINCCHFQFIICIFIKQFIISAFFVKLPQHLFFINIHLSLKSHFSQVSSIFNKSRHEKKEYS